MPAPCPVCRRVVSDEVPERPFCGPRCKLVDLGRWMEGGYRLADPEPEPAPTVDDEADLPAGVPEPPDPSFH